VPERDFGQIRTRFWSHPKIRGLPVESKLLAVYFLTGPHHNALGCYYCPPGYALADLWPGAGPLEGEERFRTAIQPLLPNLVDENDSQARSSVPPTYPQAGSSLGLVEYDFGQGWVFVPEWFIHNPIQNPNMAKHVERVFDLVSPKIQFYQRLAARVRAGGLHLSPAFKKRLGAIVAGEQQPSDRDETLSEGFAYPLGIDRGRVIVRGRGRGREEEAPTLPGIESTSDVVDRLFGVWKQVFNHPKARTDAQRLKAFADALALGFTEIELTSAMRGASTTDWVIGKSKNPEYHGKVFDEPRVLFKDAARIEGFILAATDDARGIKRSDWASRKEDDGGSKD
jgi:hypothetical protein